MSYSNKWKLVSDKGVVSYDVYDSTDISVASGTFNVDVAGNGAGTVTRETGGWNFKNTDEGSKLLHYLYFDTTTTGTFTISSITNMLVNAKIVNTEPGELFFNIYTYPSSTATGTWYENNFVLSGSGLDVSGMKSNEDIGGDLTSLNTFSIHEHGVGSPISNFDALKTTHGDSKVKAIAFSSNSGTAANNIDVTLGSSTVNFGGIEIKSRYEDRKNFRLFSDVINDMDISLGSTEPIQIPEGFIVPRNLARTAISLGTAETKTLHSVQDTNALGVTEASGVELIQAHYNEKPVFYNNMSTHDYNYLTFNDNDANYNAWRLLTTIITNIIYT